MGFAALDMPCHRPERPFPAIPHLTFGLTNHLQSNRSVQIASRVSPYSLFAVPYAPCLLVRRAVSASAPATRRRVVGLCSQIRQQRWLRADYLFERVADAISSPLGVFMPPARWRQLAGH